MTREQILVLENKFCECSNRRLNFTRTSSVRESIELILGLNRARCLVMIQIADSTTLVLRRSSSLLYIKE